MCSHPVHMREVGVVRKQGIEDPRAPGIRPLTRPEYRHWGRCRSRGGRGSAGHGGTGLLQDTRMVSLENNGSHQGGSV